MRDEDRSRWTRLVADFESADLSQREFAQEGGISVSNLRYWMYNLRTESRASAGLYSIVATCEVNGANPVAYLADVLRRAQTHPASRIDEPLPHGCRRTRPESRMHTEAVHCSANA